VDVNGAKAIVTGAAAGIGRGISEVLAQHGAHVVVADVDVETGRRTAIEIGGTFVQVDMTRDSDVRRLFEEAQTELGGIDILVNNAGGVDDPNYPLAPVEKWGSVLDLNLRSVMLATQMALERIESGVVVAVASVAALGDAPHGAPEYGAAKAAVVRLTSALQTQGGVRLACVCPDSTRTPAMERTLASKPSDFAPGPMLQPTDVGEAVLDLIRDDSAAGRVVVVRAGEPTRVIANY